MMFGKFLDPNRRFASKLVRTADILIAKGLVLSNEAKNEDRAIILSHIDRIKSQRESWEKIADGTANDIARSFFNIENENWHLRAMNNELSKFTADPMQYAKYLRMIKK